jgi:hypothetical protein
MNKVKVPDEIRGRRSPKSFKLAVQREEHGRRSHRRYPVDLSMRCKLCGTNRIIAGRVTNISSAGIQFVSSEILRRSTKVELLIDWPVLLNGICRLQLRGYGRIVRSDVNGSAALVSRYRFYTAGVGVSSPVPGRGLSFERFQETLVSKTG